MPKNIREEFLHLCHLHPRLAPNDVDDGESAMQWKTSWGSTESSSGHDATQQPVTRLHWGETSPSLSSGFSNWFLHREGWGLGKLTIWNGHRRNKTRKCSSNNRVNPAVWGSVDHFWSVGDHRWSQSTTHSQGTHRERSCKILGEMFLSSIRISLKKYFLFIVDHRDKPARRIIWLSNSNKKHK